MVDPIERVNKVIDAASQFDTVPSKTIKKHLRPLISKYNMLERDNKRLRNKIRRLEREKGD